MHKTYKTSTKILAAFVIGQATQIICHAVSLNLWEYRQIPFCVAAGFLIFIATFAGVRISARDMERQPKTYLDFAEEYRS